MQEARQLEGKICQLSQEIIELKRQRLETTSNLSLEQLKKNNPKLYSHVVRALKAEKTNIELKEEAVKLKRMRKKMRIQYFKVTQAFAGEERLKQKLKETETVVDSKTKFVDELTKELTELQDKLQKTRKNVQNVEVKKLLFEFNEVKAMKERLLAQKEQIAREIVGVQESLEKSSKNPEKVTPSAANTNLRKEILQLEAQIMDASKQIKEKEKEHLQAQFAYEEAKKQLIEAQRPPEIQVRRRVTIRDSKEISPTRQSLLGSSSSPTRRSLLDFPSAVSPTKQSAGEALSPRSKLASAVIVEHPTSPEKRSQVLNMVGKGMTETLTEQLARALKGVGRPGQGLASKLLAVNRGEIVGK
jgi:chromosome segregation ATPase